MALGQHISRLRTEQNLTQDQLAEQLGVSRQSVSKWETDASVPDLDKLVKLSQLFSVSLDELVTGEAPPPPEREPAPQPQADAVPPGVSGTQKIAALVLFGFGMLIAILLFCLGGGLMGLILASPFLLCALWCAVIRRHVGLWCLWTVWGCVDFYFRWATGIRWTLVFYTFRYTPSMNYARLAIGWVMLILPLILLGITLRTLRDHENPHGLRGILLPAVLSAVVILAQRIGNVLLWANFQTPGPIDKGTELALFWLSHGGDYLLLFLLGWTLVNLLARFRKK